jgi:hypothetical protein
MGAMFLHRIPNKNAQSRQVVDVGLPLQTGEGLSLDGRRRELRERGVQEEVGWRRYRQQYDTFGRPPIAFFSAAPFPFLPVPEFADR